MDTFLLTSIFLLFFSMINGVKTCTKRTSFHKLLCYSPLVSQRFQLVTKLQPNIRLCTHYNKYFQKVKLFPQNTAKRQLFTIIYLLLYVNLFAYFAISGVSQTRYLVFLVTFVNIICRIM